MLSGHAAEARHYRLKRASISINASKAGLKPPPDGHCESVSVKPVKVCGWFACHYLLPMNNAQFDALLDFWFAVRQLDELTLDSRMNCWFGNNTAFETELSERFSGLVEQALSGELDDWATCPRGRLALILLLEQFPRRIYGDDRRAYRGDRKALKLCEQGVANDSYKQLNALEQLFFFMPLQRAESIKIQQTSVKIYNALASRVSSTLRDTFETVAQFAELRRDIIAEFGRFPHRNMPLGRPNTSVEEAHLVI